MSILSSSGLPTSERGSGLAASLASSIGKEYVTPSPGLRIDGLVPDVLAKPGSAEEVADCLRICAATDAAVVPAGLMTWLDSGNPLRRADVVLSLERMNRIVDYSPPDLTITVEAGVSLDALNGLAAGHAQWLPLDPPGSDMASLGAVAACASSGPLRLGFGTPRDHVLGLRLAHADGSESKSGGKVVKNVAGYDMNKLYVGSFGTLAVLTNLTFKLRPLPESFQSAVIEAEGSSELVETARLILASELNPASIYLVKGVLPASAMNKWALLVRFVDSADAVRQQVSLIARIAADNRLTAIEDNADSLWRTVADLGDPRSNVVRISVPISITASALDRALAVLPECSVAADLGCGVVRLAFELDEEKAISSIRTLRSEVAAFRGTLTIERASLAARREVNCWGEIGGTADLMRAMKDSFDCQSMLNPGRFACGI